MIGAVWVVTTVLWLTPGLTRPDGAGYYAYLPSTWFDRDLLFFDEWARIGLVRDGQILFKDPTPTQHLSNHWTVGASLAWYPAFAAANVVARDPAHGFSVAHIAAVATTSAIAGLLTMLLGFAITARVTGNERVAAAAAIAVWVGSPLAFYSLRHATMSHAVSSAACALVVWLCIRERSAFAIGMAIGFACAVRPQNVAIALVPLFFTGWRRGHVLFAGALLAAVPQLIVSQTLWGAPLAFVNIGGRAHPWQMFSTFRPFETLFSWYHGLVPWTPLLVVALAGLVLLHAKEPRIARAGLAVFAAQWLLLSILERWFWGGASFGQRRFDSCAVFFIVGIGVFLARVPRWVGALVAGACCTWTMALFIASSRLNLNRYASPAELLDAFRLGSRDAQWRTPLGFTPPEMRLETAVAAIVTILVVAAILFSVRRAPAAMAAVYLVAMSVFFAWCGAHPKHDAFSRALLARPTPSGALRDTQTLLLYEAEYMERTGRFAEAGKARQEAAALEK